MPQTDENREPPREAPGGISTSSQYPPPPVFYKSYTPSIPTPSPHPSAFSLNPPRIPRESYQSFGDEWKVVEPTRSLKEEGREELFTASADLDVRGTILNLLRATVGIYGKMLAVAADAERKGEAEQLAKDLENHYVNILYLINQFRPHQAREILLHQMRHQVSGMQQSAANLRALVEEGRAKLGVVAERLASRAGGEVGRSEGEKVEVEGVDELGLGLGLGGSSGEGGLEEGEDIGSFLKRFAS